MVQLAVTLLFSAILIVAARALWLELARPLVNRPACWDDMLYDAMCDGRGDGLMRPAPARVTAPRMPARPRIAVPA